MGWTGRPRWWLAGVTINPLCRAGGGAGCLPVRPGRGGRYPSLVPSTRAEEAWLSALPLLAMSGHPKTPGREPRRRTMSGPRRPGERAVFQISQSNVSHRALTAREEICAEGKARKGRGREGIKESEGEKKQVKSVIVCKYIKCQVFVIE